MMQRLVRYFQQGGPRQTDETLKAAKERAWEWKPDAVVVASITGDTALKAADAFRGTGVRILAVPFQKHLWDRYAPVDDRLAAGCRALGVEFLPDEPKVRFIDSEHGEMANAWRVVSQGFKVAIQVATMCVDTGMLPDGAKVIAIGGSHRGADTAIVLTARAYDHILDSKVHEIITMPESREG